MKALFSVFAAAALAFAMAAHADSNEILYGPAPSWAVAEPQPTASATPASAAARVVYSDFQINLSPSGVETYNSYRLKLLRPEALAAGNITATWNPDGGAATVHRLRILRNGEVIDVLKTTKFQVLRREGNLEYSMLDGRLTATLQIPGLQVGDEIDFAATILQKDPTLGDRAFGFAALPSAAIPGAFRIRLTWPETVKLHWAGSKDIGALTPTHANGGQALVFELRDPGPVTLTDGAPARYNLRRLIEYSDFNNWTDVSQRIWPLFDKASKLSPASPVRAEISRIAASSNDPVKRTEAALQLVEDQIRYVFVGLNGGNFEPATADETWRRRFGDCKAKTALLIAILRELGVPAEAVLVRSDGGDGINEHLASPALFDHVLVRTTLAGKTYWLDGTKLGDRSLASMEIPAYRWVLPLKAAGAELEAGPIDKPKWPYATTVLEIDASAGFDAKAKIKARQIFHGDAALQFRAQLTAKSPDETDHELKTYWQSSQSWIDVDKVAWRYDEANAALEVSVTGEGDLEWEGRDGGARALTLFGAGFSPPGKYRRPKDQDQTAPWAIEFPAYRCWATSVRLPPKTAKWKWDFFADPMNVEMGGVTYWRTSDLRDNIVRTVMSIRHNVPEITAAQAEQVNKQVPKFNNKMSRVYQVGASDALGERYPGAPPTFDEKTDWLSPNAPCGAQAADTRR